MRDPKTKNCKLTLSVGEHRFLERKRSGGTVTAFAQKKGWNNAKVREYEAESKQRASATKLTGGEFAMFQRLRAHETQKQVAADLDRCRSWVNMMEVGSACADELLEYWDHRAADSRLKKSRKGASARGSKRAA